MRFSKCVNFIRFCKKHGLDVNCLDRALSVKISQDNGDWYFVYDGDQKEYFVYFVNGMTGEIKHYAPHPQVFFGVFRHKINVARIQGALESVM